MYEVAIRVGLGESQMILRFYPDTSDREQARRWVAAWRVPEGANPVEITSLEVTEMVYVSAAA